ncbi:hypothetical protein L210DRAFT_952137 [Boletus edulis BED1]|uniref:Uncharacterized protein n=1 Tax=Boletus edulis BED1 TaxID=1328754 RepID=A0AAD4GBX8_BOLED|nr:hypothetical protein L210DRAFT_952137 [Boletus edulis BED1]
MPVISLGTAPAGRLIITGLPAPRRPACIDMLPLPPAPSRLSTCLSGRTPPPTSAISVPYS